MNDEIMGGMTQIQMVVTEAEEITNQLCELECIIMRKTSRLFGCSPTYGNETCEKVNPTGDLDKMRAAFADSRERISSITEEVSKI